MCVCVCVCVCVRNSVLNHYDILVSEIIDINCEDQQAKGFSNFLGPKLMRVGTLY